MDNLPEGYRLKKLTGRDYIDLSSHMIEEGSSGAEAIQAMAEFCRIAIVNEAGTSIHDSSDAWLDDVPYDVLEKCGNAVIDLLSDEALEDAEKK